MNVNSSTPSNHPNTHYVLYMVHSGSLGYIPIYLLLIRVISSHWSRPPNFASITIFKAIFNCNYFLFLYFFPPKKNRNMWVGWKRSSTYHPVHIQNPVHILETQPSQSRPRRAALSCRAMVWSLWILDDLGRSCGDLRGST